uniref:Clustered mitochondria protein N-terminal domain-containing protein n=1 Tax=Ananas comosus var. bracteatus TaxID=296719 RepID=A0A6V7QKG9_ANACO|nr:unnamed protein product [Ananas comosus var. bracteatus]
MAPRGGRGKAKGEKKREEKVLPLAIDITINLPDESHVVLKGISTDRIIDVRRLLGVNTVTCGITCYSLAHEVRGSRLKDTVDVAALKPCVLTLVEARRRARAAPPRHRLRHLLLRPPPPPPAASAAAAAAVKEKDTKKGGGGGDRKASPAPPATAAAAAPSDAEAEMSGACPRLGAFYEFFSLANLAPPIQFVRRVSQPRQEELPSDDHLFFFEAYEDLMKAFLERNKFGNLPYGFRANTWLVPPIAAQSPSTFPPLPTEDETWGATVVVGAGMARAI